MTDAFDALRIPDAPAAPDLEFASGLRARVEHALLAPREAPMSVTEATTTDVAAPSRSPTQPPSQHTITPYLAAADARAAVDFYVDAFGAAERGEPIVMPDGRIGHVEIEVGDSVLMLADEYPEMDLLAPVTRGGPSQSLRLEVADPDAVVHRAVAAGGVLERPVADSPHGRGGVVRDPSGHRWMVSREAPSAAAPRPGDVVYTSIWTDDVERAERFYEAVLGWVTARGYGPQDRQVTNAGARLGLSGGHARPTAMLCYAVPDVDAAVSVVRAAGGRAGEPADEPHGRVADCVDDMGVPFALWTGASAPAPASEARPAIAHLVLRTPDARRARAFYGTVLDWGFVPARVPDGWNVRTAGYEPRPRTSIWGGHSEDAAVVPAFAVADLAAAVDSVRESGGTSTEPEQRRFGRAAECRDDQGGHFQLVER
ncbi:VOC family protein [Pseudonocardia sp. CA-142604]|uniref:VOC family protein n=1 Tax=Pseudonocardia sp. CA-142604 TaxID=3240024 RepID=UPI003D8C3C92